MGTAGYDFGVGAGNHGKIRFKILNITVNNFTIDDGRHTIASSPFDMAPRGAV
jgi:hypothetical protein